MRLQAEDESLSDGYQLRAELDPQHLGDVKSVITIDDDTLASASRDGTVAVWKTSGEKPDFELAALLQGHQAYVNSLAYIPASSQVKDDLIASGGNSSMILLHSLSTLDSEPVDTLIGHALNVCVLDYSEERDCLISGSWDHTARVWTRNRSEWSTSVELVGHAEAVWAVAVINGSSTGFSYLTGSADQLINVWGPTGEILHRFKGSPEPVRSLSLSPGGDFFLSACNDGLVRKWDWTGSVTQIYKGHEDYVYEVKCYPELALSCGEDHTARVWRRDGQLSATILHPCQTVWTTAAFSNGDVVTGGSDGRVRVWTTTPERYAPAEIRETYNERIKTVKAGRRTEAAAEDPNEEDQMVIDIDISDDAPPIPLTFRMSDDPTEVATSFGETHSLSENYVARIEEFIRNHIESTRRAT